jgi:hypothetical protein
MTSSGKNEPNKRPIRARLKFAGNRIETWHCDNRQQLAAAIAENYQVTGCMPLTIAIRNEHLQLFVLPVLRTGNPEAELFIARQEKALRREEFELARHRLMAATRRVNDLEAHLHFSQKGGRK